MVYTENFSEFWIFSVKIDDFEQIIVGYIF